jgi:predicted nucleotide-binding protein (sugar kinase/HSP70/actin superfamily)
MEMPNKVIHPLAVSVMVLEVQEIPHTHTEVEAEVQEALVELEQMSQVVAMEELAVKIVLMEQTFTGLVVAEEAVGHLLLVVLEAAVAAAEGQELLLA